LTVQGKRGPYFEPAGLGHIPSVKLVSARNNLLKLSPGKPTRNADLSTFDDEARIQLSQEFTSGVLRYIGDSIPIFRMLADKYPISGSKIAWSNVHGAIHERNCNGQREVEQFAAFVTGRKLNSTLAADVIYIGDGLTDFAVEGSLENIIAALPILINVAQHHYLIGPKFCWCACWTMEGDMDFGFAPPTENRSKAQGLNRYRSRGG
jgi:hypothetical protein